MAQPPLLIQEGNSESRFVCMTARTTKCQNWRRRADTIAHKSEKMANLQTWAKARDHITVSAVGRRRDLCRRAVTERGSFEESVSGAVTRAKARDYIWDQRYWGTNIIWDQC